MNQDFNKFRKSMGINAVAMDDYRKMLNNQFNGYINPTIIEERKLNVASMDVFSRLMMDRVLFLGTGIDDTVSNILVGQMLYLQSVDSETPISMYINSGGGDVYSGNSIIDTMEFIKPHVNTMVTGMAASMAFMITIHGKERSALKHARLMQHQPLGGASGQASDIQIVAEEIGKVKKELYTMISEKTGQPYDKVEQDCDRDYWMTSYEAKEYGAIDKIIGVE
jgi:ATP-dependent Clp protease protease subunit